MSWAEFLTLAPGSDRISVELFQILKDDAVESAALDMQYALNMQYASSWQVSTQFLKALKLRDSSETLLQVSCIPESGFSER